VIIIFGSNATFDAGQKGRFFSGDGSKGQTSLELHNITLKNGQGGDSAWTGGGAILARTGVNVDIYDSQFISNSATCYPCVDMYGGTGGAILVGNGAILEIHTSQFTSNSADSYGYEMHGQGGAIYAGGADIKIYTSIFESNNAGNEYGGSGGAIYVDGLLAAFNCTFHGNYGADGGAVNGANLTFVGCIFNGNHGLHLNGGAVLGGNVTLADCIFNGNDGAIGADHVTIYTSTFESNNATGYEKCGGAIGVGSFLAAFNCTFHGNYAPTGGAVCVGNGANATFVGCIFNGNNGTTGHNDITRSDDTSNVTFACANGTVGVPVTMKAGEIANPPPTSLKCTALKYSCDGLTGTCKEDQSGHFPTKLACSGVCTAQPTPAPCQVPRNCGLKNGTTVCGHKFTGCEFTCDYCCGTPAAHAACDGCTEYACKPVPPLPPPVTTKYSCVTMPNYHCIESSSGFYPSAKDCENACPPPSLSP
jgi:hypothetical protein